MHMLANLKLSGEMQDALKISEDSIFVLKSPLEFNDKNEIKKAANLIQKRMRFQCTEIVKFMQHSVRNNSESLKRYKIISRL